MRVRIWLVRIPLLFMVFNWAFIYLFRLFGHRGSTWNIWILYCVVCLVYFSDFFLSLTTFTEDVLFSAFVGWSSVNESGHSNG